MAEIPVEHASGRSAVRSLTPNLSRALVVMALLLGMVAAAISVSPGVRAAAVDAAGADLTRLLRGMAAIKALLAVALLAGVAWRLSAPVSALTLSAYGTAAFAMGSGLVLTWSMVSLGLGAVLLHAGLFGGLILFARDKAVGQRLNALLLRR
ncbi:MAG: hypothetical protein AAGI03_04300 [Pseudomonadota bacterium]